LLGVKKRRREKKKRGKKFQTQNGEKKTISLPFKRTATTEEVKETIWMGGENLLKLVMGGVTRQPEVK